MFLEVNKNVKISGYGHYLPDEVVDNNKLLSNTNLPINDEWIQRRIGIKSRHKIADNQSTSDMGIEAAKMAIKTANIDPNTIDTIILSTISPDHPNPSTACLIQAGLGISENLCTSFDISAACSGFIYALETGTRYVMTGSKRVLVIASEIRSRFINPEDPSTYAIFGDGAAAVILEKNETESGLLGIQTMADGRGYYSVHIPAGGSKKPASIETVKNNEHYIKMENGEKIFFQVVEGMTSHSNSFLKKLGYTIDDIDYVIPHQANLNILKEVGRRLKVKKGKMLLNIETTGNTSSASIPIVLSENIKNGVLNKNDKVLLIAAGAGHTMGLALLEV